MKGREWSESVTVSQSSYGSGRAAWVFSVSTTAGVEWGTATSKSAAWDEAMAILAARRETDA